MKIIASLFHTQQTRWQAPKFMHGHKHRHFLLFHSTMAGDTRGVVFSLLILYAIYLQASNRIESSRAESSSGNTTTTNQPMVDDSSCVACCIAMVFMHSYVRKHKHEAENDGCISLCNEHFFFPVDIPLSVGLLQPHRWQINKIH